MSNLVKHKNEIKKIFEESINVKQKVLKNSSIDRILEMADVCARSLISGKKLLFCGNGGSAADAQHLAAELLIRLRPKFNRQGIRALCLLQDTSTITACGNDFGFNHIFKRQLETLGNEDDVLIAISTSGNSKNIVNVLKSAKVMSINAFAFLGGSGGQAISLCDNYFLAPSYMTGRIQEAHITAGHAMMECIENILIEKKFINLSD